MEKERGEFGPRHAEPANAKIKVIATPEVAEQIFQYIADHYF
jgi:hypothetical protein